METAWKPSRYAVVMIIMIMAGTTVMLHLRIVGHWPNRSCDDC
jgi:hypothetical protein